MRKTVPKMSATQWLVDQAMNRVDARISIMEKRGKKRDFEEGLRPVFYSIRRSFLPAQSAILWRLFSISSE